MRTIEELGISPTPWSLWHCSSSYPHLINCGTEYEFIKGCDDAEITAWSLKKNNRETNLANARLIAAAPDLYEALAAVVSWYERNKPLPYEENGIQMIIDYAKKAIAKASGEEEKL